MPRTYSFGGGAQCRPIDLNAENIADIFDDGAIYLVLPKEQLLAWRFLVDFRYIPIAVRADGRKLLINGCSKGNPSRTFRASFQVGINPCADYPCIHSRMNGPAWDR